MSGRSSSSSGGGVGVSMSLEEFLKLDGLGVGSKEVVDVGTVLKTEADIQRDCLDESLVGVSRCTFLLTRGAPIQRWSVLESLWPLLESDGATAFDAIFPPMLKMLCTFDTDIQVHASGVYKRILEKTIQLAERYRQREEEGYMYDAADLPPLPWLIDQARIEKWLLPTILLMCDTETADLPDARQTSAGGHAMQGESAHHWLESLFLCMTIISPECLVEKVLAFAIHKRDPTGSVHSRVAAAKIIGPLSCLLKPNQIQDKLFHHLISLCQDAHPYVRVVTCQQLNRVTRRLLATQSTSSGPGPCASTSPSLQLLSRVFGELETILAKDDCLEVKAEAWQCIVDLLDFVPESVRRQRLIPLFKLHCHAATNAHQSTHHHSATTAAATGKANVNMLMRIFGEFLWKVSADLQPNHGDDAANTLKFFMGWFKASVATAYSNSPSTSFAPAPSPSATPPTLESTPPRSFASPPLAAPGVPAASPAPNADIELRRLAAFHFPAVVKIGLGGHCGLKEPASSAYAAGVSTAATPASSSSSSLVSTSLPAKTLTLLESLHGLFLKFHVDSDGEVRRTTAASLASLVSLWPCDLVLSQFKDPFLSFLLVSKQGVVVTEAVLKSMDQIADVFHANKGDEPMAPMLAEMLRCITLYESALGLNWRRKLTLLQQAGRYYPRVFRLDLVNLHERFIPLLFDAMKTGPVPLKLAAVDTLVTFVKTFPYTYRRHELCARVAREFGTGKSYAARMIYCDVVRAFFHKFSYKWVKKHIFSSFLAMFKADPVSNVRRKFIEVVPLLKFTIKSTASDQALLDQFKAVVGELSGADGSPGDTDAAVKAAALQLWERMFSIEINTEYDRLNRKKEAEEDALDREEENLAINLNLSASPRAADERKAMPPKRRNNSVIVQPSAMGAATAGGGVLSLSASKDAAPVGSSGPISSRTLRAKMLKPSDSINESPPPDSSPTHAASEGKNKSFQRQRAGSITSLASRPSSSSAGSSMQPSAPMPMPKATAPPVKLRPRSHSVLLTPTGSATTSNADALAKLMAMRDSHVKEEEEEEETDEDDQTSKKPTVTSIAATSTASAAAAAAASVGVSSIPAVSPSPSSSPSPPPPSAIGVSMKHKRRPSTLSVVQPSGSPASAPRSASPMVSVSPLPLGVLATGSVMKSPSKPTDKPSIISALLRGNGIATAASASAAALAGSDRLPSMTPAGYTVTSTSYSAGAMADEPMSAPVTGSSSAYGAPRRSSSPPPLGRESSLGSARDPPGAFSPTISGSRFRSNSSSQPPPATQPGGPLSSRSYSLATTAGGSLPSHASGSPGLAGATEEKLVLPRLGLGPSISGVSTLVAMDLSSSKVMISPRVQRVNLHAAASSPTANAAHSPSSARAAHGGSFTSPGPSAPSPMSLAMPMPPPTTGGVGSHSHRKRDRSHAGQPTNLAPLYQLKPHEERRLTSYPI